MHITKLFSKAVLASSLFLVSAWTMAHEGHAHGMPQQHAEHQHMSHHQMPNQQMPQDHAMSHATMSEAECTPHRQGEHAHMNAAEHVAHCQTVQPKNQEDQKGSTDSKNKNVKGDNHAHH
ncbi:hypothetical protein CDG60_04435 [Acinetobacter chinensis]|uniref:Copper-binding protein n=1 Tax=Acinetobacter chinensis TaxID=2004650 RepID=A0A3B7LW38_9GAMM|nr:hypothetical protein [Acinetobacter chinensis]AXY55897.1 hypothetical protein CDG60_04435 [Acinetobacter chinensis]